MALGKEITEAEAAEALEAYRKAGSYEKAASLMGVAKTTLLRRCKKAHQLGLGASQELLDAAEAGGIEDLTNIRHFWKKVGDDYSIFVRNPHAGGVDLSVADLVREALFEGMERSAPRGVPRSRSIHGEHLLVVDLADVHFQKLCVRTETGYEYNREIARHRVKEGTAALLRMAVPFGIKHIVFVVGNDILHTDNVRGTTTSGTPQDTEGSIFQAYHDAYLAMLDAIDQCAEVADVTLLHCMSNHDWTYGWMLSQTLAAHYHNDSQVTATAYNVSERHRKYFRFGNCLLGFTHGDGAKEEKLLGAMVSEAREHISECEHLYWFLHHFHHKISNSRGSTKAFMKEKDHIGMTSFVNGSNHTQTDNVANIEYLRSPSPPDGWHDRNAYLNRQAVEAFVIDAHVGQRVRLTEWF